MVLLSFLIAVYGSVVVAWSILYLFSSMNKEVPWERCKAEWHIGNCTEVYSGEFMIPSFFSYFYVQMHTAQLQLLASLSYLRINVTNMLNNNAKKTWV